MQVGVDGETLEHRATDGRVQIIVQPSAGGRGALEEGRGLPLQDGGALRLAGTRVFGVLAIEQAVHVIVEEALAGLHRLRVAQHQQHVRRERQAALLEVEQDAVGDFDRRRFVAVHAAGDQHAVGGVVQPWRDQFENAALMPACRCAVGQRPFACGGGLVLQGAGQKIVGSGGRVHRACLSRKGWPHSSRKRRWRL